MRGAGTGWTRVWRLFHRRRVGAGGEGRGQGGVSCGGCSSRGMRVVGCRMWFVHVEFRSGGSTSSLRVDAAPDALPTGDRSRHVTRLQRPKGGSSRRRRRSGVAHGEAAIPRRKSKQRTKRTSIRSRASMSTSRFELKGERESSSDSLLHASCHSAAPPPTRTSALKFALSIPPVRRRPARLLWRQPATSSKSTNWNRWLTPRADHQPTSSGRRLSRLHLIRPPVRVRPVGVFASPAGPPPASASRVRLEIGSLSQRAAGCVRPAGSMRPDPPTAAGALVDPRACPPTCLLLVVWAMRARWLAAAARVAASGRPLGCGLSTNRPKGTSPQRGQEQQTGGRRTIRAHRSIAHSVCWFLFVPLVSFARQVDSNLQTALAGCGLPVVLHRPSPRQCHQLACRPSCVLVSYQLASSRCPRPSDHCASAQTRWPIVSSSGDELGLTAGREEGDNQDAPQAPFQLAHPSTPTRRHTVLRLFADDSRSRLHRRRFE